MYCYFFYTRYCKKIYKKTENVSRETFSISYFFILCDVVSASEKNVLIHLADIETIE